MQNGWLLIASGALIVALGGVITTFGWIRINDGTKMRSLTSAVAREWEINDALRQKLSMSYIATAEATLKYRLHTRFGTSALNNALGSGLFSLGSKKDKEFLKDLADYKIAINEVNHRLDFLDRSITFETDLATIRRHRKAFIFSDLYIVFVRRHRLFKEDLEKKYSWIKKQWSKEAVVTEASSYAY